MERMLSNRSIIQSTLFNILISVFILSMVLISLFGKSFWEKESLKLNYELLSSAFSIKEKIDSKITFWDTEDKKNPLSKELEVDRIDRELTPLLEDKISLSVVYYDLRYNLLFSKESRTGFKVEKVLSGLSNKDGIQKIHFDNTSLVSVPISQGEAVIGYLWAYGSNPEFSLVNFSGFNVFFMVVPTLLCIIIIIIQRHMKNIQLQLEDFSESIAHPESAPKWNINKLPELEPVFDKIKAYTMELSSMNEELIASQQRINQIMEGISDGLFAVDREWQLLFYNDVAKEHFNKSEKELSARLTEIIPDFSSTKAYQFMTEGLNNPEPVYFEGEGLIDKGRLFNYSVFPFKNGVTVFFRDITEQRKQQQEMARFEQLNLVAQMAAGISHEIRNPLTTVKGFLQLRGSKTLDAEEQEYNDLMISEIDRANTIISEFLSLARNNNNQVKKQDINHIIYKIFPMVQADAVTRGKDLILNLNPIPSLQLNENEIRQLLLNLTRNALEVTPQGGCVIIRTYEEKDNVVLAVQDQGCGIPEEIQNKIGTPFFTTKESGTGLGIAISMGIARRHNAELVFDTGEQGTTFKVIFYGV